MLFLRNLFDYLDGMNGDRNDPTPCRTESTVGRDTAFIKIKAEIPSLTEAGIPEEHSEN